MNSRYNSALGIITACLLALPCFVIDVRADFPRVRRMVGFGGGSFESAGSVAVAITTNCYFLGRYGPTTSIGAISLTNNSGFTNVFLSCIDYYCTPLWARTPVTDGPVGEVRVASSGGNAKLAGSFFGTNISFQGVQLTNYSAGSGQSDVFLATYNGGGNLSSVKQFGGSADDVVKDVMGGPVFCYLTGGFKSPVFQAGATNLNLQGTNQFDGFLLKCDAGGNVVWARQMINGGGNMVTTDNSNNVYVAGTVSGSFSTGGLTLSNQTEGTYLAKFDSTGNPLWVRGDMNIGAAVIADRAQSIVTVGAFTNIMQLGSVTLSNDAASTAYVAKFNSLGEVLWAKQLNGLGNDRATSIFMDTKTNYWISGAFRTPDLSGERIFLACYNPEGELLGVSQASGVSGSVVTDMDNGNIFGTFNAAICGNFATNLTMSGITITNDGNPDVFVGRLDMVPPTMTTLSTNNDIILSWPQINDGYTNVVLESSVDGSMGSWANATNSAGSSGGRVYVTNSTATGSGFFRLKLLSR